MDEFHAPLSVCEVCVGVCVVCCVWCVHAQGVFSGTCCVVGAARRWCVYTAGGGRLAEKRREWREGRVLKLESSATGFPFLPPPTLLQSSCLLPTHPWPLPSREEVTRGHPREEPGSRAPRTAHLIPSCPRSTHTPHSLSAAGPGGGLTVRRAGLTEAPTLPVAPRGYHSYCTSLPPTQGGLWGGGEGGAVCLPRP